MANQILKANAPRCYSARKDFPAEGNCQISKSDAAWVAEPATTVQGLVAKLAYFDELAGEFETEWMVYDRPEAAVLIQSFAASLRNIGVQS